ncbi:MAG TPA: phenylalanine--tRNA ligase subunit beta [Holophagaceae bacterium]|nr:phenylalanine--tRNA ligase subunit beta [Holophagaceae bacterium]
MLIQRKALHAELPGVAEVATPELCHLIANLGFPVDAVMDVDGETVLDVDITANRGDLMSHRGLARDLGAKLGAAPAILPHKALVEGAPLREIRLESALCARYATAVLALGGKQSTPADVVAFLASLGAGAKQLAAVDASNELLHLYGHPTHAFDADKLKGAIAVRLAKAGEALVTLDGVERKLTSEDLVIADEAGPVALAGVMGGEASKVTAGTRRVLLESAWFDPRAVRLMARRHGLHTDASHRFGRGADIAMATVARDLLAARLMDWAGATLESAWTVGTAAAVPAPVILPSALMDRIAGEPVDPAEAEALLQRLGCGVTRTREGLEAVPPTWRHDLAIPEDLAEEVLRVRGYERIPESLPPIEGDPEPLAPGYLQRQRLSRRLAHLGFFQTVTYGFLGPDVDAEFAASPAEGRTIGNPLGLEYSVLRSSLLPSLREAARHNLRQGAKEVRLFEIAPTYASSASGPVHTTRLGFVWAGQRGGEDFLTPARPVQGADLRGVALELGADATVHDLGDGVLGLELDLASLPGAPARVIPPFQGFSRFPAVERDLSLLVDLGQSYAALAGAMRAALPAECQDLRCVDVFRHRSLPEGRQAWLLRLRFQGDRTLTSEEVDGWMKQALAAAESQGATLRG